MSIVAPYYRCICNPFYEPVFHCEFIFYVEQQSCKSHTFLAPEVSSCLQRLNLYVSYQIGWSKMTGYTSLSLVSIKFIWLG